MKLLYLDCFAGISGDMFLGALIDLGVSEDALRAELAKLKLPGYTISTQRVVKQNISATKFDCIEKTPAPLRGTATTHSHRGYTEIAGMITGSGLSENVKRRALSVFRLIGEAEAKIHGVTLEKIHFHEVGAVDSIVDIVGACIAMETLGVDEVQASPPRLGSGFVETAHGKFPVPAPATLELLKGFPVVYVDEPHELVTPTGAALLTSWPHLDAPPAGSRPLQTGYSFGHRTLDSRPNLLRATLLESEGAGADSDVCLVLECNVDDTTPELIGVLIHRLLEAGALDAFTIPAQMKKQRPGVLLTILCRPPDRESLLDLVFRGCTTFGVREHLTARTMLERRFAEVQTEYGPVKIKVGRWRGEDITFAPEMEDCLRLAREQNVSARTIYEAACRARPAEL